MAEADKDPQAFLSELFTARHELLTIKTMAEQGSEIYRRAIRLTRFAPPEGPGADGGPPRPVRDGHPHQPTRSCCSWQASLSSTAHVPTPR